MADHMTCLKREVCHYLSMNHTVGFYVICSQSICQNLNRALHLNIEGAACVGPPSHKFLYSVPCSFGRLGTLFFFFFKKVSLVLVCEVFEIKKIVLCVFLL